MRHFRDHIQKRDRILYVSKGPSGTEAKNFLGFGHVATMNDSSRLIPGPIDYASFGDLEALLGCREDWPRIKTFLVPDFFHVNSAKSPVQTTWVPGFPTERAVHFPIEPIIYTDEETRDAIAKGDRLALCNSGTVGLHMLALLGYRQIWCLGYDGGTNMAGIFIGQTTPCDHTPTRRRMELIARCLKEKLGTDVRFWPDRFPEEGN